jgi:hypothetical protein
MLAPAHLPPVQARALEGDGGAGGDGADELFAATTVCAARRGGVREAMLRPARSGALVMGRPPVSYANMSLTSASSGAARLELPRAALVAGVDGHVRS